MSKSITLKGDIEMNIEFIDNNKVLIKEKYFWNDKRPAKKIILKKHQVLQLFKKEHPDLIVESIEGPASVSNFRTEKDSVGEWTLKVTKKSNIKAQPQAAPPVQNKSEPTQPINKKTHTKKNRPTKQKEV